MAQKGFNVTKLAEQIEQKESLLTKKLDGIIDFVHWEIVAIREALSLTPDQVNACFFDM